MTEAEIRDNLISRLAIIQPDLVYLEKEKYLRSELGTKGFIDILATDAKQRHVIIELKKSNSAAREALHEVLKYLEGIKGQKSLRDDEIRVIIVSTVWEELLIPFSSFCQKSSVNVEGYHLLLDENGVPFSATSVTPIRLVNERLLADEATLDFHENTEGLESGIRSQEECFKAKDIEDYILVIMNGPRITGKEIYEVHEPPPDFDYAIYSTTQRLSKEFCLDLLSREPDIKAKVVADLDQWETEEERIRCLHANILDIPPFPVSDYKRIGTAAKFSQMTWYFGWAVDRILRYGKLRNNELLTDTTLIAEIQGSTGTNRAKYDRKFQSDDPNVFNQVRNEIKTCLVHNLPWQQQILQTLDDLERTPKDKPVNIKISVYNPMNFLYTIYLVFKYQTPLYIPMYSIEVTGADLKRVYLGTFDKNANAPSLSRSLNDHFDGDPSVLLFGLTSGGYVKNNVQLTYDNGLDYCTFRIDFNSGQPEFSKFLNHGYVKWSPINPLQQFQHFLDTQNSFCTEVINLFAENDMGGGYFTF